MRIRKRKLEYTFELYVNVCGRRVLGKTGARILEAVEEHGSMAMAANKLGMSYRFTWNCLSRMRKELHQPIVVTRRGGTCSAQKKGGGGTTLTPAARVLLKEFGETERVMRQILSKREVPPLGAGAPLHDDPCPAVQPKQYSPVTIRLEDSLSMSKSQRRDKTP